MGAWTLGLDWERLSVDAGPYGPHPASCTFTAGSRPVLSPIKVRRPPQLGGLFLAQGDEDRNVIGGFFCSPLVTVDCERDKPFGHARRQKGMVDA